MQDWKDAGAETGEVAFSCVGRHYKDAGQMCGGKRPCNYTGCGLIHLNPVHVVVGPEGQVRETFEFADAPATASQVRPPEVQP